MTRVVRGDAPVATLAAEHNRVGANAEDTEDVILRSRVDVKPRRRSR